MRKQKSIWIATAAPATPSVTGGDVTAGAIVIGAGITGLLTALELQRRGEQVLLIDPRTPGTGTTGHTTGKITSQHGIVYQKLSASFGEEQSRLYAEANEWAVQAYSSLIQSEGIECQFSPRTAYLYTESASGYKTLHNEWEAARRAGIDATLSGPPLAFTKWDGLAFPNQAQFHSAMFIKGALEVFARRGGYFRSERVQELEEHRDHVVVKTPTAELQARAVVTATLYPFDDHSLFAARMVPKQHHGMAFRIRSAPIEGMYLRVEEPTFSFRWTEADGGLLIAVGSANRVGELKEDPYAAIQAYTATRFDIEEECYRWSAHDQHSPDSVPYIGRYSMTGAPLFTATGFKAWGLSHAMVASRLLSDLIEGRDNPWQSLYDPLRLKPVETAAAAAKQAFSSLKHLVVDRLRASDDIEKLRPGQSAVLRVEGEQVGAYRDENGQLHLVTVSCPHMGCILKWDPYDHTWSCPCHGSRFDYQGEVLYGPATKGIGIE